MATLKGHTGAVTSLIGGVKFKNMLCSGSADKTIRVWDLDTMQCTHLLDKHSEVVMSLRFWEEYLFSGSLDKTLKVCLFVGILTEVNSVVICSIIYTCVTSNFLIPPSFADLGFH